MNRKQITLMAHDYLLEKIRTEGFFEIGEAEIKDCVHIAMHLSERVEIEMRLAERQKDEQNDLK